MTLKAEVIVVGGGVVGVTAAYLMARAGQKVLLLDPPAAASEVAASPGGPLEGGVVWEGDLSGLLPGWPTGAPIDRRVVERRLALLTSTSSLTVDYRDVARADGPAPAFVLERRRWNAWLLAAARKAGATVWSGPLPGRLLVDGNGRVEGIEAGPGRAEAPVTVLEDPRGPELARRSGVRVAPSSPPAADDRAEVVEESAFALPLRQVDERFGAGEGRGTTLEAVLGFLPKGAMAFGYVVPAREGLWAGVVAHAASLERAGLSPAKVAASFEAHPAVAPYLRGARRGATSRRTIPGRGRRTLFGDGFLLAGDAAGITSGSGLVARGMDAALRSAGMVAGTVREAVEGKDPSGRVLGRYAERLRKGGVLSELERAQGAGRRLKWNPRVHELYPRLFTASFRRMMTEQGQPKEHMRDLVREVAREAHVPYTGLLLDALAAAANL